MRKTGITHNLEEDEIRVVIEGENLAKGTLVIQDIVLQMDGGGGEYHPVQYTTASITCVSNGSDLFDLYTEDPLAISVEIRNYSENTTLFRGFVSPNAYNQPFDGLADTVTIECVDWLGIAMYVPYKPMNISGGFSTKTLADILIHIAGLISDNRCHYIYIPDNILIKSGNKYVHNGVSDYLYINGCERLVLSEAYALTSPEPATLADLQSSYLPVYRTCYEILSMIAESFRCSFLQYGVDIYMHDALFFAQNGFLQPKRLPDASNAYPDMGGTEEVLTKEHFASSGSTISMLPRYSMVAVKTIKAPAVRVTPDIFAESTVHTVGDLIKDKVTTGNDPNTNDVHYVQLLSSDILDIEITSSSPNPDYYMAQLLGYRKSTDSMNAAGQNLKTLTAYRDGNKWETMLRLYSPTESSIVTDKPLVTIKKPYRLQSVASEYYSLRIDIEVALSLEAESFSPWNVGVDPETGSKFSNAITSIYISVNNMYYDPDVKQWTATRPVYGLNVSGENGSEWLTYYSIASLPGYLTDTTLSGEVNIEIWPLGTVIGDDRAQVLYVKKLNVDIVPNPYAKIAQGYYPRPETIYHGTWKFNNQLPAVNIPMGFGFDYGMSDMPFSTVVDGRDMVSLTVGDPWTYRPFDIRGSIVFLSEPDGEKYTLIERIYKLANFGDGTELQLPLRDRGSLVHPITAFTSDLWQGRKVIVGFTRDIRNSIIMVTLN